MNPKTLKFGSYGMLIIAALYLIVDCNVTNSVSSLIICILQYMIYHELKDKEKKQ